MEQFIFDSAIRWYHFYQYVWKAAAGEKLHAEQEFDSPMDKFAVKVKKNNETVGHLSHGYSWISWYFLANGGKICLKVTGCRHHSEQLCGEMEIRCRLLFSCLSEVLKELLENKNWRWTLQDINGSCRSRHSWKIQWSTTTCFQFVICVFTDILRCFVWILIKPQETPILGVSVDKPPWTFTVSCLEAI